MAYSPNTTNPFGRRSALALFFAGLAASTILGRAVGNASASIPGCPDTDAQLFARWREYLKSEIELNAAEDARDLMSWNARQAYPPKPDRIGGGGVKVISSAIDTDGEGWTATTDMKSGGPPADERMAEIEAWCSRVACLLADRSG
jgi:hypothetical protein